MGGDGWWRGWQASLVPLPMLLGSGLCLTKEAVYIECSRFVKELLLEGGKESDDE